ncbi:DUF362 domain-containing protein, partial [bacterium]|nr:DUF362 domain-containing protein [bacterium]
MRISDHRVFINAVEPNYDGGIAEGIKALLDKAYPGGLKDVIRPGDKVVIKPNVVKAGRERKPDEWEQVVTNGSVVRAVCDEVIKALEGKGEIIIAEAPQTDTPFSEAMERCGIKSAVDYYQKNADVKVTLLDLRKEEWLSKDGIVIKRTALPGEPEGYEAVDLKGESAFAETDDEKAPLYGADYDIEKTAEHHSGGRHEYLLSATCLNCEVLINIPKLKTHKKTGLTCAMKNLVGINGDKNWLPHYRLGDPASGGDQFEKSGFKSSSEKSLGLLWKKTMCRMPAFVNECFRPLKAFMRLFYGDTKDTVRSGNWYGNDTCWRMVWDLNKAFFTAAKARRYLTVVDGVVAGEGDGPLDPDRKECGWLALS